MKMGRLKLLPDGKTTTILLSECRCIGQAQWVQGKGFTLGRRGPDGGVCGACGGAIPRDTGEDGRKRA